MCGLLLWDFVLGIGIYYVGSLEWDVGDYFGGGGYYYEFRVLVSLVYEVFIIL